MTKFLSMIVAAMFAAVSVSAIAASHAGAGDKGKMMEKGGKGDKKGDGKGDKKGDGKGDKKGDGKGDKKGDGKGDKKGDGKKP